MDIGHSVSVQKGSTSRSYLIIAGVKAEHAIELNYRSEEAEAYVPSASSD